MQLTDLLNVERISCNAQAASKKRALESLSGLIALGNDELTQTQVFDSLIARERLGSTGLGRGVAIPHGRVKNSDKTVGAFIHLEQAVDFDAIDKQPVDLMFALLVPEQSTEEHLQLLAKLAEMFSDKELVEKLRAINDPANLLATIEQWQSQH